MVLVVIGGGSGAWPFGMPPVLHLLIQFDGVECRHKGQGMVALTNNFDTVGGEPPGSHVGYQALANAPPTGLFATPLDAAAGPGELLAVEQAATGADHSIGEMGSRALKNMPCGPGMF
jgi:hypothetical protein